MKELTDIIGKTLKEVKEKYKDLQPTIRIVRAGDLAFVQTMDFQVDRLNVEIEGPSLEFEERRFQAGNSIYNYKTLKAGSEDAIVVGAYWG